MHRLLRLISVTCMMVVLLSALPPAAAPADRVFPEVISLPDDFQPEGIAIGRGTSFYAGSLADGSIYKGDVYTGTGSILVQPESGRLIAGLAVDTCSNILFAAGTLSGRGFAFDAESGDLLAEYQLATDFPSLINDVVVTRDSAYFTDSFQPFFYRLPLGRFGSLPDQSSVERIPLGGEFVQVPGPFVFNSNGIEASSCGRWLLIINSNRSELYRVDPRTGDAVKVDVGDADLSFGDGLCLRGHTLYLVQNRLNRIAVIRLAPDFTSGTAVRTITDPDFAVPTTVDRFGPWLYAVNSQSPFTVVRVLWWGQW